MSATHATAVVYQGPGVLEVQDLPIPDLGVDEMLVSVVLCGVDGSELHMFKGEIERINRKAPVVFGDEIVGRVEAIGESARARRGIEPGDLITVEARWPCASGCSTCDRGQYFLCENNPDGSGFGTTSIDIAPGLWGGYASHLVVPASALVYKIPDGLPLDTALIASSVFANGLRWVEEAGVEAGNTVLIIGPGPQGLACTIAATLVGGRVIVVGLEQDRARLSAAEDFGAEHAIVIAPGDAASVTADRIRGLMGSIDVVIEVAGFASARDLAFEAVSALGTVVNVAVPTPEIQSIDWRKALLKEVRILNLVSHPHAVAHSLHTALTLLDQGIDIGTMITHEYPFAQAEEALRAASYETTERPIKVVLTAAPAKDGPRRKRAR